MCGFLLMGKADLFFLFWETIHCALKLTEVLSTPSNIYLSLQESIVIHSILKICALSQCEGLQAFVLNNTCFVKDKLELGNYRVSAKGTEQCVEEEMGMDLCEWEDWQCLTLNC